MTRKGAGRPIRIWALLGARAGDNDQVLALAEAIGLPFETKQLEYNRLRVLGPRLLGRSVLSLTRKSQSSILTEPPPDLTISAGHRSVAVVRALRRRSDGRTRSIHVGFPRVSPDHFDLVIATPQYPIPDHPKLLRVPYALTRSATTDADQSDRKKLDEMPQPRRLLIVGGPTLFWDLDRPALLHTLAQMADEAADRDGSVIVTTSPRTPLSVRDAIAETLAASSITSLLASPGSSPRYASLLAAADTIRITADSVAMVSDAIWTGKPLALVPITKSPLGHIAMAVADGFGQRLYPQDLRCFWRALAKVGVGEKLGKARASTDDQMRFILGRVTSILESIR